MTRSLIFFGSDQYAKTTLSHLAKHSDFVITHLHDLKSIPPITPDTLGLCASFDYLIPQEIIELFSGNLYNLHPSLLPQYRNVSPVQYAIALGDKETGITLFRISPTIDDGEIISQVSEPIHPDDTTPTLTTRLFTLGAQLFTQMLQGYEPCKPITNKVRNLVFTRRLTRNSGFIEWPTLHKLLQNQPILPSDTTNELLSLRTLLNRNSRLQAEKGSSADERRVLDGTQVLSDLCRSLYPWPGVWSLVPTRKGDLRISLVFHRPSTIDHRPSILISGKPAPILYNDFIKYYLGK